MSNINWSRMVTKEMKEAQALEALKTQVTQELQSRRSAADQSIAPLADAVEFGEATAEEEALLTQWKQYRILLTRVPKQPGYPQSIDWPVPPI